MSTLRASVSAGESGPLITLSGETDITTIAGLSELVTAQLSDGTLRPVGDWPAPCAACGEVPEQIIEVVEAVVGADEQQP